MKNLETVLYNYKIMKIEEINGIKEFVVCDVFVNDKLLYSNQHFPYKLVEKYNLINIGDKFTYLLDNNHSPTLENIRVIHRKEEPSKKEKKIPTNYNHNGILFPLH